MRVMDKNMTGKKTWYYYRTRAAASSAGVWWKDERFSYTFVLNSQCSLSFFLPIQEHDTFHLPSKQYLSRLKRLYNIGFS